MLFSLFVSITIIRPFLCHNSLIRRSLYQVYRNLFASILFFFLSQSSRCRYVHPQFVSDVMKPMKIEPIIDQEVQFLSGGELQRVAMALALGKPCDVYLIDEPSAYLDRSYF